MFPFMISVKDGFVLIELIFAVVILSLSFSLSIQFIKSASELNKKVSTLQTHYFFALNQLSRLKSLENCAMPLDVSDSETYQEKVKILGYSYIEFFYFSKKNDIN